MLFYELSDLNNLPENINYPDIYFTPEYGKACEYSDDAIWELCQYKDLIYVYLKKEYIFEDIQYFDLITPYGYSGYYFNNDETLEEFIPLFRVEAMKRNYLTEVIRQNPYIDVGNININSILLEHYDIITTKTTFGINLKQHVSFEQYLTNTHRDNKRGYKLALKNGLICKFEQYNKLHLEKFILIYETTMNNLNSQTYYYFNSNYYQTLMELGDRVFFANVYNKEDILIASCIIFRYNKRLHYHLGGSLFEYRNLRPNNYLHCNVIKYGIENDFNLYHLGGGVKEHDTLYDFKNKIGDTKFAYTIYKTIINPEIYNEIKITFDERDNDFFPIHRK